MTVVAKQNLRHGYGDQVHEFKEGDEIPEDVLTEDDLKTLLGQDAVMVVGDEESAPPPPPPPPPNDGDDDEHEE